MDKNKDLKRVDDSNFDAARFKACRAKARAICDSGMGKRPDARRVT
ncbi:UNVERIFIED_ORG: hypothetical protein GGI66_005512 [Rhizobium esperanzae]|nr:hypothetical protein [Rhizobium phaseoli]